MASSAQLPEHFKCPISLEIMSDPVILPSGHTFDRPSIQRWLNAGHRLCPITKLPLPDSPSLIPNHALRSLISHFTLTSPHHPHLFPPHPETLIPLLTSKTSPLTSKTELLSQLVRISQKDSTFRRRLTESGAVTAVIHCVDSGVDSLVEKALSLLLNLSLDDDNKVGLVAEGVVGRIVGVLASGSDKCRAIAATLVTSLAVLEVNKITIGEYPCVVEGLVEVLRGGKGRERKEAATALYALCSFVGNRRRAVECGVVGVLFECVDCGLERGVEVLGVLGKCKEGREEMKGYHRCVEILGRVLRSGTSRGVQYALLALNCVCGCSERLRLEAVNEGLLEICFKLLDDDSEKVRRNSSNLIQVLRGNQGIS